MSGGALAGIIVGCIAGILLLLFAGYYMYRNRNQGQSNEEEDAVDVKAVDGGDADALQGLKEEDIRDYKGDGALNEQDIP